MHVAAILTLLVAPIAGFAGAPMPFTEESASRGLSYTTPFFPGFHYGSGLAFADLDGDRDPDAIVTGRADGIVGLFENDGSGHFTDRSAGAGIPSLVEGAAVVAFDFDGDRDIDLFFSQHSGPDVLVRNDGGFAFTDVSQAAGVAHPGPSTGASATDVDGDGWIDLHVPAYDGVDRLYRSLGDGTFVDVAADHGTDDPWRGWQSLFFDMDQDGDADLYVSNDKRFAAETTMHNRLYENVEGSLVDVSTNSGSDISIFSMGVAVGDFKGHGRPDLYCTNLSIEPNVLLLNDGQGRFLNATATAGVASMITGWAATFLDYDNDGHMDLYVCNMGGPNRLYSHGGGWPCVDVAPLLGVNHFLHSFAAATADVDDDGDLDFMVQSYNDHVRLYINHAPTTARWIKLNIEGSPPTYQVANARVVARSGRREWHREIHLGGNSFKSQNDTTVHIGLGDVTLVDVTVYWPNHAGHRTLRRLSHGHTWTAYPRMRLGDGDGDGVVDAADMSRFAACFGIDLEPGCEMMDFDGRGDVNAADLQRFLQRLEGTPKDCDGNGIADLQDVLLNPPSDLNGDLVPDVCH